MSDNRQLLNEADAMDLLDASRRWLRCLVDGGVLRATVTGSGSKRRYTFLAEDVERHRAKFAALVADAVAAIPSLRGEDEHAYARRIEARRHKRPHGYTVDSCLEALEVLRVALRLRSVQSTATPNQ